LATFWDLRYILANYFGIFSSKKLKKHYIFVNLKERKKEKRVAIWRNFANLKKEKKKHWGPTYLVAVAFAAAAMKRHCVCRSTDRLVVFYAELLSV
jgi:hypothetical protein